MSNDFEELARSLLKNCGSKGEGVSANFDKYASILSSPEGRRIISGLTNDGGKALKKAANDLKKGDMDAAKSMLSSVMSTKEGSELISRVIKQAKSDTD